MPVSAQGRHVSLRGVVVVRGDQSQPNSHSPGIFKFVKAICKYRFVEVATLPPNGSRACVLGKVRLWGIDTGECLPATKIPTHASYPAYLPMAVVAVAPLLLRDRGPNLQR